MKTILVVLALMMVAPPLRAANGVTPGQFVIEPATLICLGFEWDITGDENRNATVDVSYRVSGQTKWSEGMAFQVSDVQVEAPDIRETTFWHALISFAFNTTILALALNVIFGLVGGQ